MISQFIIELSPITLIFDLEYDALECIPYCSASIHSYWSAHCSGVYSSSREYRARCSGVFELARMIPRGKTKTKLVQHWRNKKFFRLENLLFSSVFKFFGGIIYHLETLRGIRRRNITPRDDISLWLRPRVEINHPGACLNR